MGWSGGNDIVEPVIREMQTAIYENELDPITAMQILATLVDACRDRDWDTECETLGLFRNRPWIVEGFARAGVTLDDGDDKC